MEPSRCLLTIEEEPAIEEETWLLTGGLPQQPAVEGAPEPAPEGLTPQRELHSEAEDRIAMQLAVAESQQEMLQAAELKKERKTAGAGTGTQAPGT